MRSQKFSHKKFFFQSVAKCKVRSQTLRYPCSAERENELEVNSWVNFAFPFRWTRVTEALGTRLLRATVCFSIEHARARHAPRDAFDVNLICQLTFCWDCFGTKEFKYISPKALTKERFKSLSKYCIYLVCGLNITPKFKGAFL